MNPPNQQGRAEPKKPPDHLTRQRRDHFTQLTVAHAEQSQKMWQTTSLRKEDQKKPKDEKL